MVHGFGSNPEITKQNTPNLTAALIKEGFNVEFVNGPIKLKREDYPFEPKYDPDTSDVYGWWLFKTGSNLDGVEEFILKNKLSERSDIVGIMGLSQGGSTTTLLTANYKRWVPSLKFAVSYGGFLYPFDPEPDFSAYDGKIALPFLTVVGDADEVILPKRSLRIADELVEDGKSTVFHHDGGHIFAEDEVSVDKTIQWIRSLEL